MESIDVRDLPEDQAQLVAAFVEFLRRQRAAQEIREAEAQERDWGTGAITSFAKDWENVYRATVIMRQQFADYEPTHTVTPDLAFCHAVDRRVSEGNSTGLSSPDAPVSGRLEAAAMEERRL